MRELQILVVDDYPLIRHGLRTLLEAQPGWKICSEAATGQSALQKVKRFKPQIILLDLGLPDIHGLEIIPQIVRIHPHAGILAMSDNEFGEVARTALATGAQGIVLKSDRAQEIIQGVRAIALRNSFQSLGAVKLMKELEPKGVAHAAGRLTPRELQILKLLAEGKTNKEVAAAWNVSVRTAEAHRASLMRKLNLRSASDLIYFALRNRIVSI